MTLTKEIKCGDFINALASKTPTPGGGGASAFGGALGMALGNMVGNLTIGKKKYIEVETEIKELVQKSDMIIAEMMDLVDKDTEVFEPLAKAYSLHDEELLQKCCKEACAVPIQIMQKAFDGILLLKRMGEIGTTIAISDVGCGAAFMKAALIAAKLNVLINLNMIKDQEFVAINGKKMEQLYTDGCRIADQTLAQVENKITCPKS